MYVPLEATGSDRADVRTGTYAQGGGLRNARDGRTMAFVRRDMKPLISLFALLLGAGLGAPAFADSPPPHEATLTVTGSGTVSRAPDRATIPVSIVTSDDNATRALSANNAAYAKITRALVSTGLAAGAVTTTGFSIQYNPRPAQPNPQYAQRYGFVVTRNLQIVTDVLDRAGPIVDAVSGAGDTTIGGVYYGFRDPRAVERDAQSAAVADAQAQADVLAGAAHQRIVRIIAVTTGGGGVRPIPLLGARAAMAAAPLPTELAAGPQDVNASVTIVYGIAPR